MDFSAVIYTHLRGSVNSTRHDSTDTIEHKGSCLVTHKKEVSADKTFHIKT